MLRVEHSEGKNYFTIPFSVAQKHFFLADQFIETFKTLNLHNYCLI